MSVLTVVGVDPGQSTGITRLTWDDGQLATPELIQTTPRAVELIVSALIEETWQYTKPSDQIGLAIERFVVGNRAARSASPQAGEITRSLIGGLSALFKDAGVKTYLRSASEVKPWASDKRLDAIGVHIRGMTHAHDAARHALFAAVHDFGAPDPLSTSRSPKQ